MSFSTVFGLVQACLRALGELEVKSGGATRRKAFLSGEAADELTGGADHRRTRMISRGPAV
jgi:hypothetical protein